MHDNHRMGQPLGRLIWSMAGLILLCIPRSSLAQTATTTKLALSSDYQASGVALTLTATVTAGVTPVTLGTVVFCKASATNCMDSAVVGTAQLTSAGTASLKVIPSIGTQSYKAIFRSTSTHSASTSVVSSMTVAGTFPTTTAISTSGSAGDYYLTGQVVATGSLSVSPTGTVAFTDASNGNYGLGSATLGGSTFAETFAGSLGASQSDSSRYYSTVADFNKDGIIDIAVVVSGGVNVLLASGKGAFTLTAASPYAVGSGPRGIAAGDVNGDGNIDLVISNYSAGTLSVLLGTATGLFRRPPR